MRCHVFPVLGKKPLAAIERADCRALIAAYREKGLSPKSLENICRTVSSVLTQAVEDELLAVNPAFRLGRYYRKADHPKPEIRPLTREEEALRRGWKHLPAWVFCNETGKPLDGDNLRHRIFHRVLAKAGLRCIRLHDLRHTFASLLIQQGESLA